MEIKNCKVIPIYPCYGETGKYGYVDEKDALYWEIVSECRSWGYRRKFPTKEQAQEALRELLGEGVE